MSSQARIVMGILVVLVVFLAGLQLGSSGDGDPISFDASATSAAGSDPETSMTTTSATPATTGTTAAPPAPTPTAAPPTTDTTLPFVLIVEDAAFLEKNHGIDLDTGSVYTFPNNPDLMNLPLQAAVDVVLSEVLLGATGFNVVVSPRNGARVVIQPADDDSCLASSGPFGADKVFVNFTVDELYDYFCFETTEGNFALMAPIVVTGTQDPATFFFLTVEPPGLPGSG